MAKIETQSLFTPEEYKANFVKNKKSKAEEKIQMEFCDYVRYTYPDIIFMCDLASGLKLPIWIAAKNKQMRSSKSLPDFFAAEPRKGFNGLFIELKKDGIRLKSGAMPTSDHIRDQEAILERLRQKGYKAEFAVGIEEAKFIFDEYMK